MDFKSQYIEVIKRFDAYTNADLCNFLNMKKPLERKKVANVTCRLLKEGKIIKFKQNNKFHYKIKENVVTKLDSVTKPEPPKETEIKRIKPETPEKTIGMTEEVTYEKAGEIFLGYLKKLERKIVELEDNIIKLNRKLLDSHKRMAEQTAVITKQNETIMKVNKPDSPPSKTGFELREMLNERSKKF